MLQKLENFHVNLKKNDKEIYEVNWFDLRSTRII